MIAVYIPSFATHFSDETQREPWAIVSHVQEIIRKKLSALSSDFVTEGEVAIHRSATVEQGVVIKGPTIIGANCFIGAHAYLRGGVYLGTRASIGPGCEVKSSFILEQSALAHFNFVGDSIVGANVNMEAGSIICNHFNERVDKLIQVMYQGQIIHTQSIKFGALVGDHVRIGANAVLSPGTLLPQKSIVKRLELVEQVRYL